jgi:polysaccharide pyruvyl transferase WcaK-like protein
MDIENKKIKNINILIIAWIGQGDFGDEAMAYTLRKYLKMRGFNNITYYQMGKLPVYKDEGEHKLEFLHSFNGSAWKRKILDILLLRKYNAVIIGGGSVFHSFNSVNWKYNVIKKAKRFKRGRIFSACIGVSLGPFKSPLIQEKCGDLINNIDSIILRDNHSAELAKKISGNNNIYPSLDTTLLLPELCPKEMSDIKLNVKRDDNLVGVFFIKKKVKEDMFNKENHLKKYLSILNNVLEENKKVILFTLYIGEGYPDKEVNEYLLKNAKYQERVELHEFNGDIFRTAREMSRCGYIISMRLHGIIFSYMLGIPFLSLGYDPKNKYFCESIKYPADMCFDFYSLENVDEVLASLKKLFNKELNLFNSCLPIDKAVKIVRINLDNSIKQIKEKL